MTTKTKFMFRAVFLNQTKEDQVSYSLSLTIPRIQALHASGEGEEEILCSMIESAFPDNQSFRKALDIPMQANLQVFGEGEILCDVIDWLDQDTASPDASAYKFQVQGLAPIFDAVAAEIRERWDLARNSVRLSPDMAATLKQWLGIDPGISG